MKKKYDFWIDIDNAPHVQIFAPIINQLEKRYMVLITAKDYGQTIGLLNVKGIHFIKIGKHPGKSLFFKITGSIFRAIQLFFYVRKMQIKLAVSHGSRSLIIASFLLRIKSVVMFDYEYSEKYLKAHLATFLLIPDLLGIKTLLKLGFNSKKIFEYPGMKENIYVPFYSPDTSIARQLGINSSRIIVLFRPPSEISHYNKSIGYNIINELLAYLLKKENLQILITLRYSSQLAQYVHFINHKNVILLNKVYDGLDLINLSDIVISGGGTMNREAAVMGVPVYSVFQGSKATIDLNLAEKNKLIFIEEVNDFQKIILKKKSAKKYSLAKDSFTYVLEFLENKLY